MTCAVYKYIHSFIHFIRPTPAPTCSSHRCLPYRPFGGRRTPFALAKLAAPPQDPRSAVHGTTGVVPVASLNASDVTSATGVTARISVSTVPPLPRTVVHALAPVPPSLWGLVPRPLVVCPLSLDILIRLLRPLCRPPFQCFPELHCGNDVSSCVLVPCLLYAFSSVGELDLPFAPCSCSFGASSSFSCSLSPP